MRWNDNARVTISLTNANASNVTHNAFDVTRDAILTRPAHLTHYVDMFYSTILFYTSSFLDAHSTVITLAYSFIVIVFRIDSAYRAHDLPEKIVEFGGLEKKN